MVDSIIQISRGGETKKTEGKEPKSTVTVTQAEDVVYVAFISAPFDLSATVRSLHLIL